MKTETFYLVEWLNSPTNKGRIVSNNGEYIKYKTVDEARKIIAVSLEEERVFGIVQNEYRILKVTQTISETREVVG